MNNITNTLKAISCSIIISVLSIISATQCFSQSEFFYTVNNELPNSNFSSLCQDNKGNIWIGTANGLSRYDGAKFRTYNNYKNNPYKIHDNAVNHLYSSDSGALYVSLNDRIQVLNENSDNFKDITFYDKQNKRIEIYAKSFIKFGNDCILIGTLGHGIFLLKKGSLKAYPFHPEIFGYYFIDALHIDNKGRLLIGEERNGIIIYDKGKISSIKLKNNAKATSFCQPSPDVLYIGTSNGLFSLNIKNDEAEIIKGTENDVIACILKKDNQLLIGTETHGLKIYNIKEHKITERPFEITTLDLSKSKISSMLIDSNGNYWLAINKRGILMKPAINNKFQYIGHKSINKNIIGDNSVNCIYKDINKNLWIATDNDGLYCIDESGKQKHHFCKDKGNNIPNFIISMCEDIHGKLWIGAQYDGMACFDTKTGKCKYIDSLKGLTVCGIVSDKAGNLWVGTMGNGLYQFDCNGNLLYKAPIEKNKQYNSKANVLNNSWICSLLVGNDNKLYISTCYGLGCYDLKKKSFISTFNKNSILLGMIVNTAFEDSRNIIWIGTAQGLYSYNPADKKINDYGLRQGLGNSIINGITEDKEGNIWVSTNYGLSKFDIKKKVFANFYAKDGLQGNEFSARAVFKDDKNTLFFGGVNGVTYFDPSSITKSMKQLNVRITDFYIHDQAVQLDSYSSGHKILLKKDEDEVTYHLGASDNSFCIEFSTNPFPSSQSTIYEYSLNHKEWNSLQPGVNKLYFSNMNAGKYSFRVRANNFENKSKECEIYIVIDHYWYATTWAFMIYAIIIAAILSYLYIQAKRRQAVKAKLMEQEQKDKISEAKLQFFINISHEIRTPMTLIISPLKKLIAMDKSPECQKLYHTIYRNADKILLLVNQLMDIRKIDKGQMELHFQETDIISFIRKIADMFEEALTTHNINLEFNTSQENIKLYVDPLYFDKIIVNLLSNAIKYTPDNGIIKINIQTKQHDADNTPICEIEVYDNGLEIQNDSLEKIFDRYYQINNNINEAKIGTGVGLNLTRSLVELHHGKIKARNLENGVSFIIDIPLGHAHLKDEDITDATQQIQNTPNEEIVPAYNEEAITLSKKKSNKTILIVEDDSDIRTYLKDELSHEFNIELCSNGKEALDNIFEIKPDLVISDVMMPVMDGMTLCHKIKQNINLNYIPVILLTAKTGESDTMEGLDMGADIYMTKPFNMQILHSTIINLLVGRERLKNIYEGNQQQDSKIENPELKSPDDKLLERVMKYMNQNLTNPDYTVEMLAKDVGLSRVHLHRKLKELTNQTTRDFMRNLRLQKAAELLSDKKLSISEVAMTIGFQNTTYFSSAFKELFGMSPKEFRNRNN